MRPAATEPAAITQLLPRIIDPFETARPPAVQERPGRPPGSLDSAGDAAAADVGRNSLILTLGTLVSRLSGQLRTVLLVAAITTVGTFANSFDIANKLPNQLFALLSAGVLQAVLMPQIMRAIKADNTQERLDKLLTLGATALLGATIVLFAATPLLIRVFTLAGPVSPEAIRLAIAFGYWCIPQVFFYGLFALVSQVLNARGQFGATGWAPIANNVVSVAGFGAFILLFGGGWSGGSDFSAWSWRHTALLGGTATLGIAAQSVILLIALRRGGFHWHLRFGVRGIGLRAAGSVVGWTIGAVVLEQVGTIYLTSVTLRAADAAKAAGVTAAGPASFTAAMTIYLLPHSLVVVSIITALAPRMTMAATSGDLDGVRTSVSFGLRSAGVFSVISAAVLFTLAEPVTKALLVTLSPDAVAVGAPVLRAMSVGLVALGATVMVKRMYFAFEDGRGIFVIQVIATAVTIAGLLGAQQLLPESRWAVAAAAVFAGSAWVSVLLRVQGMRRKLHGIDGVRVLRLYVRAFVAALAASGVGFALARALRAYDESTLTWGRSVLVSVVAGTAMLAVYVGGLKLMRVREVDQALKPVMRRLRRQ